MVSFTTIFVLWLRELKRYYRAKSRLVSSFIMPLFFLISLGFGLSNIMVVANGVDYLLFLIPGIICMGLMNSSLMSGISVIWDREFGFLKEIMVAPVDRLSIALGRVAGGMTTSVIQAILILIITLFLGLTINSALTLFVALGIMFLTSATFVGLGLIISSFIKDLQGFGGVIGLILMPLLLLSGAFYPVSNLPLAVRVVSYIDPLTYGVDALRSVLVGTSSLPLTIDLVVLLTLSVSFVLIGTYLFKRSESV